MDEESSGAPLAPIPLMVALRTFAVLLALSGPACAAAWLARSVEAGRLDAFVVTAAIACAFTGPAAGCVLWALAWLVRRRHEATPPQRAAFCDREGSGGASPAAGFSSASADERVLAELAQINANLLLGEQERRAKWERRREQLGTRLRADVERALAAHEFGPAEDALRRLIEEFGEDERSAALRRRISEARAAAENDAIAAEMQRTGDLMAVSSFREAESAAEQLTERFPDSEAAASLLVRVRRETNAFTTEQQRRLFAEIQRHADARQWRRAFEAAQRLLREYPKGPDTEEVSLRLPTLQENARIEEVRQMRDRVRELLGRRRYAEALRVAEDIVSLFPDTQAAGELRGQMERIRGLAKQTDAD